ncbi:MAG TPA: DUF4864 domain-containing protein [Conexibacter sp.]
MILALFLLPSLVLAQNGVTGQDAAEIRAVIHRQIEAFMRDDAKGAFALAAPSVQRTFGTPEKFLDAIRAAYRAVYRPAAVAFLPMRVVDDEVVQPLRVTDASGRVWVAYYAMQRQRDGSWRASGCYLASPVRTFPA